MIARRSRHCAIRWTTAGLLCLALLLPSARATEVDAYLVGATDYVFRGVSYSDGRAAAQAGVDFSFDNGLYAGLWASTLELDRWPFSNRELEIDYYAGYSRDLSADWTLGFNAVFYTFPRQEGGTEYDTPEIGWSLNYRDRYWLEYAWTPDLFDSGKSASNVALLAEWSLSARNSASLGAGVYDVSNVSGDDYAYWQAGISRSYDRIGFDLRYHDTSRWLPKVSTAATAGARIVFSITLNL